MKLRTSFFNPTVLKKDITRFAPVWGLYSVFLLLVLMVMAEDGRPGRIAESLHSFTGSASVIQLIYGGICAAVLFGDLFTPRLCNAIHALPLRREGWFLTHLAAGCLFFLVPTGLFSLLMLLIIWPYWQVALVFLAVQLLMFLFFFGVGAFCAVCAGNRLGMTALYGIIQFLPLFVMGMVYVFYDPFLYGVELQAEDYFYHSPALALAGGEFLNLRYRSGAGIVELSGLVPEAWRYLGWTVATGVAFVALAVALYRRRALESAGDFISAPWLRPVFLGIYCVSVGMLFYLLANAFDTEEYIFLFIGLAVGFFTGKMLLEKTVRVFKPRAFLTFGGVLLVLILSMIGMALDAFGIVHRVPRAEKVASVQLQSAYGWTNAVTLEEKEDIEAVIAMHQSCLGEERTSEYYSDATNIELTYTLRNGSSFTRNYPVSTASAHGEMLRKHFSSWQCVFGTEDWEGMKAGIIEIYVDKEGKLPTGAYNALLEAIRLDCEAGNMTQDHTFHQGEEAVYWIEFVQEVNREENMDSRLRTYLSLNIFESCENTLAVLDRYFTRTD